MKRLTDWLATLPSTNARISVTLCCVALTALVYLSLACFGREWVPDAGWLTFLAAMSGIDGAVFATKRLTQKKLNGGAGKPSGKKSP